MVNESKVFVEGSISGPNEDKKFPSSKNRTIE